MKKLSNNDMKWIEKYERLKNYLTKYNIDINNVIIRTPMISSYVWLDTEEHKQFCTIFRWIKNQVELYVYGEFDKNSKIVDWPLRKKLMDELGINKKSLQIITHEELLENPCVWFYDFLYHTTFYKNKFGDANCTKGFTVVFDGYQLVEGSKEELNLYYWQSIIRYLYQTGNYKQNCSEFYKELGDTDNLDCTSCSDWCGKFTDDNIKVLEDMGFDFNLPVDPEIIEYYKGKPNILSRPKRGYENSLSMMMAQQTMVGPMRGGPYMTKEWVDHDRGMDEFLNEYPDGFPVISDEEAKENERQLEELGIKINIEVGDCQRGTDNKSPINFKFMVITGIVLLVLFFISLLL